jgi:hypothetical protein
MLLLIPGSPSPRCILHHRRIFSTARSPAGPDGVQAHFRESPVWALPFSPGGSLKAESLGDGGLACCPGRCRTTHRLHHPQSPPRSAALRAGSERRRTCPSDLRLPSTEGLHASPCHLDWRSAQRAGAERSGCEPAVSSFAFRTLDEDSPIPPRRSGRQRRLRKMREIARLS